MFINADQIIKEMEKTPRQRREAPEVLVQEANAGSSLRITVSQLKDLKTQPDYSKLRALAGGLASAEREQPLEEELDTDELVEELKEQLE